MSRLHSVIDLRRLVLVVSVGAVALGLWLLFRPGGGDSSPAGDLSSSTADVQPAALVDTPLSTGEGLQVAAETDALAPDFEASDLDGNRFRLSDYRGRPVLLNFWAVWCTACKAEMPAMQAVLDEHRAEGFAIIAVNMGDEAGPARGYLEDVGVDFDVAMDPDLALSRAYRIVGLPVSYFIDADGVIRRVRFGEMTQDMVETFTHEILGSGPASAEGEAPEAAAPPPAEGEPAVLRITEELDGPGTMLLQSPSLRCAADFCAGYLLLDLREAPGVTNANSRVINQQTGDWGFVVTYDPARMSPDDITAVYQRSLTEHPDPVYPAPHRVEYLRADR